MLPPFASIRVLRTSAYLRVIQKSHYLFDDRLDLSLDGRLELLVVLSHLDQLHQLLSLLHINLLGRDEIILPLQLCGPFELRIYFRQGGLHLLLFLSRFVHFLSETEKNPTLIASRCLGSRQFSSTFLDWVWLRLLRPSTY